MKPLKSIRGKLFFWYATSLVSITAFFYLAVHIFALPYGGLLFLFLLVALALEGLFIIRKMTSNLTKLSSQIKSITSKNLQEKISGIDNQDEIGELADSFNELLTRLDEAFKRERQFIADVAHELKTPLSTLRSGVEIALEKDRPKEEYRRVLGETLIDINQIATTLKNILDLAWSDADQSQLSKEKFSLSEQMIELKELASKMAYGKKISVRGSIENGINVLGKRDKLGRAILNLIDNAVKYTERGKTVTINLLRRNNTAIVKIKDTGPGIAKKDLAHIFERFYRGGKTDKVPGSGLGLAIVKTIIAAHRGQITVKSKTGHGTTMTITLPILASS